jgi:hypothetical protein
LVPSLKNSIRNPDLIENKLRKISSFSILP